MPLPTDVLNNIRDAVSKAQAQLPNLQAEIARMQRAGQDATALNTRVVTLQQQVAKLKQTYPEAFQ